MINVKNLFLPLAAALITVGAAAQNGPVKMWEGTI